METEIINISLTEKQSNAWVYLTDNVTEELLFGGGAGGGKSMLGCLWLISSALQYPGTRWVMARAVLKRLKETTLNTFFEISNLLKVSSYFEYNDQKGLITFNNGSTIILKDIDYQPSDPNFDSLGSLEITGAFVDEVAEVSYKAVEVLKSRIRYKLKKYNLIPKILYTCNPSKNWSYTEFYIPNKEDRLPDYRRFLQSLATDNEFIDPTYIKSLERLSMGLKMRLLYGEWEYGEDNVLFEPEYFPSVFVNTPTIEYKQKYLSIDVARTGSDRTIICLWYDLHMIKMWSYTNQTLDITSNYIREIMNEEKISNKNVIVDATGVGAGVVDMLKVTEFISNNTCDGYKHLKAGCYFKLSELFKNGGVKITINNPDELRSLMQELEIIKIDDKTDNKLGITSKDEMKKMLGRSPDIADAIMMRMYYEIKPKNTFYVGKRH